MKHTQFLRSAERHLQICKGLLSSYEGEVDSTRKSYILQEVYYLSGYVLETGLSYAFFSFLKYTDDIYKSEHLKNGGFKTHDISMKYNYMITHSCLINELVFISFPHGDAALQEMFNEWSVNYRYEHNPNLKFKKLCEYMAVLEKDLIRIKTLFPIW